MMLTFFVVDRKVLLGKDVLRFTPGLRLEKGLPYPQVHRSLYQYLSFNKIIF